jgi:hypothetical protein
MRSILAFGLSITFCATTNAATLHRAKPHDGHLRTHQFITIRPVNALPPRRISPFPVGLTNRPNIGCTTPVLPLAQADSRCESGRTSAPRFPHTVHTKRGSIIGQPDVIRRSIGVETGPIAAAILEKKQDGQYLQEANRHEFAFRFPRSQWAQLAKAGTRSQDRARPGYDFGLPFRQRDRRVPDLNALPKLTRNGPQ